MNEHSQDWKKLVNTLADLQQKLQSEEVTQEQLEWFLKLTKRGRNRVKEIIKDHKGKEKFIQGSLFSFTVPEDYNHDTVIASLDQSQFYVFGDGISDDSFCKTTDRLVPGKEYMAKLFYLVHSATYAECMNLYSPEYHLCTGVQGLALMFQIAREKLPKNIAIFSLDEIETWPMGKHYRFKPCLQMRDDGENWLTGCRCINDTERFSGYVYCFLVIYDDEGTKAVLKLSEWKG